MVPNSEGVHQFQRRVATFEITGYKAFKVNFESRELSASEQPKGSTCRLLPFTDYFTARFYAGSAGLPLPPDYLWT